MPTITVEDGTGVTGANSYITSAQATTYHDNHGNTDWTSDADTRTSSCIRGASWLDNYFLGMWKGAKTSSSQAMQWPRQEVTDEDGESIGSGTIPQRIKDANALAALAVPKEQQVDFPGSVKRVKGGSAEVEFAGGGMPSRERIDLIRELVLPYLKPGGRLLRGAG